MTFSSFPLAGIAVGLLIATSRFQPELLGEADFDDGTVGSFTVEPAGTARVVNDPLNSRRGKVLELTYRSDSIAALLPAAIKLTQPAGRSGLGSSIYFSGDVLIPASTFNLGNPSVRRTLVIVRGPQSVNPADSTDAFIMLEYTGGCELRLEWSQDGWWRGSDCRLAAFEPGRWHRIELQATMNSATDRADGILELRVNGNTAFKESNVRFTNPLRKGTPSWQTFLVGAMRLKAETRGGFDLSEGQAMHEVRYWDNVSWRTERGVAR